MKPTTRRRFIGVSAAAAGLSVLPFHAPRAAAGELVVWRGQAMGAVCELQIHHPDRARAERLVEQVLTEVRRLDRMFSLYDPDSTLARFNRAGFVDAPPPEFVELLRVAHGFSEVTDGVFDATVQPLWSLYADHFAQAGADPAGPAPQARAQALARVGYRRLEIGRDRVAMAKGMGVTLNGIAQGFITDRIVDLLRAEGVSDSLVQMGETRALGRHPQARSWEVGIENPDAPGRPALTVPLVNRALATSGPYGFVFDGDGRFNHLFDPATGACAHGYRSVSVVADAAATADALSTAFCFMPQDRIARALRAFPGARAYLLPPRGDFVQLDPERA